MYGYVGRSYLCEVLVASTGSQDYVYEDVLGSA